MSERNPAMDPERGEAFRRGREIRYVFGREEACGEVGMLYATPAMQKRGVFRWVCIDHWQRWASKAQLVECSK